jgi:hypothetical protein
LAIFVATAARSAADDPAAQRHENVASSSSMRDTRLGPLAGEKGDFLLTPAASPDEWQARRKRVRQIMQVSLGLWLPPTSTPLNAVIRDKRDFGDYTIEKVYFESLPGFFVTGSLYRPTNKEGRRPAVLSPHGHFPAGRFQDSGPDAVRWEIARGAERFEDGGRSVMQSRHVQLARMGCVVFHYDMIGYADSQQLTSALVHRFSGARQQNKEPPERGFYSAAAELRLQNVMGLHTYNSQRAIDFLIGLPDVDPERIAVTGASGGGTQTFMLCAVDDRPLVSVPVVIVSADRQGGCTCENICGLRIDTHNLDFTALHAPKPLLLISANDDTRTMPQRGFPQLREHYRVLGAEANLEHAALLHFPHNYNYVSRTAMYHFVNKHLKLGLKEPILESPYKRLTAEELTVWDDEHQQPPGGREFELKLLDYLASDADKQFRSLAPTDEQSLARYREVVGTAWDIMLRRLPDNPALKVSLAERPTQRGKFQETTGLIEYQSAEGHGAHLPLVQLDPPAPPKRTMIWLDDAGKAALYGNDGSLQPDVQRLLEAGTRVVGVDLLFQGDFLADGKPLARQRWLAGEEGHCGWTYCYNLPLFAKRVHDVLAVIEAYKPRDDDTDAVPLEIVARGPAAIWAAAAIVQSRGAVSRAALDTREFRFADLSDVYDVNFLPGAVKYGDVPGLLALAAPTQLILAGDRELPEIVVNSYRATGKRDRVRLTDKEIVQALLDDT